MTILQITGKKELNGEIQASGAKNLVTKLLVASLLSSKKVTLSNVPEINEVSITVDLCKEIGMLVDWNKEEKTIIAHTPELKTTYIPQRFSGSNRIPILMIGALLGRTNQDIIVPTVGGCKIGKRPVNFHVEALRSLGANIEYRQMKTEGAYFAHAHNGLKGDVITLPYPSVGATENTILAAVTAEGTTVIKNAAVEPEIVELILFLQKLGANITLDTDRSITIQGTKVFNEVEHRIIPDRIEVASLGIAAIATKGRVFIKGAEHLHIMTFLNKLREVGGGFSIKNDGIEFFYNGPLKGNIHLETDVHPGFLTDWQQPFVVLLTQASGPSVIHETVYENRFGYTKTLNEMGADIALFSQCLGDRKCRFSRKDFKHSAVVQGQSSLVARDIAIPDLRGGFAYVVAALVAEGTSRLSNLYYLNRGYENLVPKLQSLGADIEIVPSEKSRVILTPKAKKCSAKEELIKT